MNNFTFLAKTVFIVEILPLQNRRVVAQSMCAHADNNDTALPLIGTRSTFRNTPISVYTARDVLLVCSIRYIYMYMCVNSSG